MSQDTFDNALELCEVIEDISRKEQVAIEKRRVEKEVADARLHAQMQNKEKFDKSVEGLNQKRMARESKKLYEQQMRALVEEDDELEQIMAVSYQEYLVKRAKDKEE